MSYSVTFENIERRRDLPLLLSSLPVSPPAPSEYPRSRREHKLQYETGNGITVSANTIARKGLGGLYEDESGKLVPSEFLIQKTGSYSAATPPLRDKSSSPTGLLTRKVSVLTALICQSLLRCQPSTLKLTVSPSPMLPV
ncbi:unnamed protein product [Orchesella dallaii]|uniref:Uncharacterized protein n=1 Tax=Orchesella dallaii TaxID=48710 RepID=A0ABP1QZW6_9HEXA